MHIKNVKSSLKGVFKCTKNSEKPQPPHIECDFHKLSLNELVRSFNTSLSNGLNEAEAKNLLAKNGKNLMSHQKKSVFVKLLSYLFTGFCGLLWIGSIVSILSWKPIGNPPDPTNLGMGILLLVVIFLQASFSAFQDWSSNRVMNSIKEMMPHSATVIREGHEQKIQIEDVVVGDLVCLTYGNKVPADVRITESHDLKFDKSMLTGESEAIEGTVECTDDRYVESKNIAYMTTLITSGQGKGIVVCTGNNTFMGKIATLTSNTHEKTSMLHREITRFVSLIAFIAFLSMIMLVVVWSKWLRVSYPNYIDVPSIMVETMSLIVAYIPTG